VTTCTLKRLYLITDGTRTLITSVEVVSVEGAIINEMLFIPGKRHLESWYPDLDDNVLISVSDTSYTNDELLFEWIKHFHRHLRKTQAKAY
jgi:hypothetical protein